jgi:hypothetical protein
VSRRPAALAAFVMVLVIAPAGAAFADPAGPTEYRTEVLSVDPAVDGVGVEIIGGDAFVRLTVDPGTAVDVVGYQAEPFLRFGPDGIVEVNENSPTTYLSDDRYGDVELPPNADPDAEPAWLQVSSDGSYAWHDHRTHWMNPNPPPGGEPGERILEAVVPIVVDGEAVSIAVASTWEQPASPVPAIAGAVVALGLVGFLTTKGTRPLGLTLGVLAVVAMVVGLVAYLSVPGETGPSVVPWALAGVSLIPLASVVRFPAEQPPLSLVAMALVLAVWGIMRWDWMWAAILPTSFPTVDRFATALVLVSGVGTAVLMAWRRLTNPTA